MKNKKTTLIGKLFPKKPHEQYYVEDESYDVFTEDEVTMPQEMNRPQHMMHPMQVVDLQIDLIDAGEELVIKAHLPGVKPDELDVDIQRKSVSITTQTKTQHFSEKNHAYIYQEMFQGNYSRSVMLTTEIDVEEAHASLSEGVLTVVLPKMRKEKQQRKLQIRKTL